jgi:hypothetical protein
MIETKKAKDLFLPLRGMPMEPSDPAVIRTRYEALANHARTVNHACRVVKHLAETLQYFPTVAEVVHACEYTPDDEQAAKARKDCQYCDGGGWRIVEGPNGTSAAFPCTHAVLAEKDRRMGVPMSPAVQAMYRDEAVRRDQDERGFFRERLNAKERRKFAERPGADGFRKAQIPQAGLDAIPTGTASASARQVPA